MSIHILDRSSYTRYFILQIPYNVGLMSCLKVIFLQQFIVQCVSSRIVFALCVQNTSFLSLFLLKFKIFTNVDMSINLKHKSLVLQTMLRLYSFQRECIKTNILLGYAVISVSRLTRSTKLFKKHRKAYVQKHHLNLIQSSIPNISEFFKLK